MYRAMIRCVFFFLLTLVHNFSYAHSKFSGQFQLDIEQKSQGILLHWKIADQAFLYKDRIHWTLEPNTTFKAVIWPKSAAHTDKLGQSHAVYFNQLDLYLPYAQTPEKNLNIKVQYQGCSLSGVCFPPATQEFSIQTSKTHFGWELLTFLGLGILLAFTPCVLPMLPIMTKIVLGDKSQSTGQTLCLSSAYVLGMASSYAAVGGLIASIGKNLFILMQQTWISITMALVFIVLGLATLGVFKIQLPQQFQTINNGFRAKLQSGRLFSAFIMGSLALLVLSPCVTAPLLAALTYITQLGQVWKGSMALFCLGLGMGLPLMIFAVSAGHYLPKAGNWMYQVNKILATLLFAIAALLFSRALPASIAPWIWALVLISTGILFYPQKHEKLLVKVIKYVLFLGFLGYFAWQLFHQPTNQQKLTIHDHQGLHQLLSHSKKHPVILYFSAKWCSTCQYIEHRIWQNQAIQPLLAEATLIKVDLTKNTHAEQALMQEYGVIAPPTLILLEPLHQTATCRLLGEEITISKLQHWRTMLHQAWSMNNCQ